LNRYHLICLHMMKWVLPLQEWTNLERRKPNIRPWYFVSLFWVRQSAPQALKYHLSTVRTVKCSSLLKCTSTSFADQLILIMITALKLDKKQKPKVTQRRLQCGYLEEHNMRNMVHFRSRILFERRQLWFPNISKVLCWLTNPRIQCTPPKIKRKHNGNSLLCGFIT